MSGAPFTLSVMNEMSREIETASPVGLPLLSVDQETEPEVDAPLLAMLSGETAIAAAPSRQFLLGCDREELEQFAKQLGEPVYRGRQLARWLYRRGARSFEEMSDLPAPLRARLAEVATVGRGRLITAQTSRDGTTKLLLEEGGGQIETVLLPYEERVSVCISSQVGCPVGCTFCATATMGFARNLTAGEMVDQVLAAQEAARQSGRKRITHVVVMGMGEPLINLNALLKAIRLLNREVGIAMRHITVSTAGYVPGIRRLAEENLQITLALSLHAPNDEVRVPLIPLARKYPLAETMAAVRDYATRTGRRVTLEYLLLAGVNDSEAQALELARLVHGMITHVNLIPWNPADSFSKFQAPSADRIRAFRRTLERHGLTVTQRVERGQEISAACGQLAVKSARVRSEPVNHEDIHPLRGDPGTKDTKNYSHGDREY
jgi:23S rRNA (adenine2503-C2)-methyltransferase